MALGYRLKKICEDPSLHNPAVVQLIEYLRDDLQKDINDNRAYGINIDSLTVRQKNALANWVFNSLNAVRKELE